MKIGKFIIRSARKIRRAYILKLKDAELHDDSPLKARILQIYSCRFLGLCFYRDENTYEKEEREILNEVSEK